ncbi:unnamed protein product [Caenorhabditis brenneri]
MAQYNAHRHVRGWIQSLVRRDKEVSTAAIAEQILHAATHGPFFENQARDVWISWTALQERGLISPSGEMSDIVSRLLTRHSGAEDQRALRNELMMLPAETQYDEFTRSFIRIHITSNVLNGRNVLAGYKGASIHPIYIDTESSPFFLRNGTKTALLSLFDVRSRQVLLWRIDEMSPAEIEDVKDILGTLARTREFMSYGHEDFFARFHVRDIQHDKCKSLKNAAAAIGFNLSKKETCSNWTSNNLREDQIHYSAMDSVVLHYVHVGHTVDWLK